MAMEQGGKNITVLGNGAIRIGNNHTVRGDSTEGAIKAAMDAYGKRIGTITYTDGTSQVVNEYKENPRKDVDPSLLKEIPKVKKVKKSDGTTAYAAVYEDGTISYSDDGKMGAYREASRAKKYNDFVTDGRTRADFNTDEQYNSFLTVKATRLGQGTYTRINNADGTSTLKAPNGATIASGTTADMKKMQQRKGNTYSITVQMATQAAKPISTNEKRYIMQTQNLSTDEEFNTFVRNSYQKRINTLNAIHQEWDEAAADQGLLEVRDYYTEVPPVYDDSWTPTIIDSTESYGEWYSANITQPESGLSAGSGGSSTITGDETGLEETGLGDTGLGDTGLGDTDGGMSGGTGLGGTMTGGTGGVGPITSGDGIIGGTTGEGTGTSITGADQDTGLPTLDDLGGGMTGGTGGTGDLGGGMTGGVTTPSIDYTQLQDYNPASGTFTYTGTPVDQQASGTFTMGQSPTAGINPPTANDQMTGINPPMDVRTYRNAGGLTTNITFINGQPQTPIPQGFYPTAQQQQTGTSTGVDMSSTQVQMARGGIIYASEGVDVSNGIGNTDLNSNETAGGEMDGTGNFVLEDKASPTQLGQQYVPIQPPVAKDDPSTTGVDEAATITDIMEYQATTPGLPTGGAYIPAGVTETQGQFTGDSVGQLDGDIAATTSQATTTMSTLPDQSDANLMTAAQVGPAVNTAIDATTAAQMDPDDPRSKITAAQATETSVSDLEAAEGNHIRLDNPTTREIMDGELISGSADAEKAAKFTEAIQHAEASPSKQATVQGQLEGLMEQFEGGETPVWAAGAMRTAMQTLAKRGIGSSSMAGQAVVQAAMEASLPIAQADAATVAQFEFKNLSNKQERAMLAAQQRAQFMQQEFDQDFQSRVFNATKISEAANLNFTAEQQIALENSRAANTMELQNLSNEQALVMAEAAALSQLDMANLNNLQQAAVQNAQNFLSIEMQNLSNKQQTELFKKEKAIQALFTDQAATNAAEQFNASSKNQVDQFFASLTADVSKFNANQANAQAQFNAGELNAMEKFEEEVNNQRDQFNANNQLVISQSNAQWRREIATADTEAVNRANEINAAAVLGMNQMAYNNLWQYYNDSMSWAWTSAENQQERATNLAIEQLRAKTTLDKQNIELDYSSSANFGAMIGKIMTTDLSGSFLEGAFDALTDLI